jgi:multidrug resistance efflux pump
VGVERAVTRWYVQRQGILSEISSLTDRLAQLAAENSESAQNAEQAEDADQQKQVDPGRQAAQQERSDLERQLATANVRLLNLGPCPKPMMG